MSLTFLHRLCLHLLPGFTLFANATLCCADPMPVADFASSLQIHGNTLTLPAGSYQLAGGPVHILHTAQFTIAAVDYETVRDEPLELSPDAPQSWDHGTALRGLFAEDINAQGALDAASLKLTTRPGGAPLALGRDYMLSPEFGMVGLAPGSPFKPHQRVFASYRFSLRRIDALFLNPAGQVELIQGTPHLARPLPPEKPDSRRLANIYRPYHSATLDIKDVFPILETSQTARTQTIGHIPKTMAKIHANQAVRIVFLGDSVTEGCNASTLANSFVERMRTFLFQTYCFPVVKTFPHVSINLINLSFGGTNSSQWLRLGPHRDYFKDHPEVDAERINFDRVIELHPDLVCIEFVNDAGLDPKVYPVLYDAMLTRLRTIGAEVILITPHYTAPTMMALSDLRAPDPRPYTAFLRAFAEKNQVGLADASARWQHLWREGIPYTTLLGNTLNHPDDRGHALFAAELQKCFTN
jgi:lysophospholipase L1-like esterase